MSRNADSSNDKKSAKKGKEDKMLKCFDRLYKNQKVEPSHNTQ